MSEVIREIATERRLEFGDLLCRVAIRRQRRDVDIVEKPQPLNCQQPAADDGEQVHVDHTVADGDRTAEAVALEQFHHGSVRGSDHTGDHLTYFVAGQQRLQPRFDEAVSAADDRRLEGGQGGGQDRLDPSADIDEDEQLIGEVGGHRGIDLGLLQSVIDGCGDLVAVEQGPFCPDGDRCREQADDRQDAEEACNHGPRSRPSTVGGCNRARRVR